MGYSVFAKRYSRARRVNVGLDCCCATSVRTSRGSRSSWGSHTGGTAGLWEEGGVEDSARSHSGGLIVVKENRRGRKPWRGQGGRTGVEEEEWAWGGKGGMKRWARGRRTTLRDTRLGSALRRKGWRGGQNKGKGTHRGPGGS